MALARPRGELGHIRPKLPSSMAPPRPPLGAPAGPAHSRNGLGVPAPWYLVLSGKVLEGPRARALLMVCPREPIITRFWAPIAWRASALGTARLRDGVCTLNPNASLFSVRR
ncbi:hypothetical protein PIB30_104730, partial [Stylosanthes scabra]|nr:hypothetical protein [Stylosanthes scabra]